MSRLSLNKDRYVPLLQKLIGETEFLQDNPPKFVPQEDRCGVHVHAHTVGISTILICCFKYVSLCVHCVFVFRAIKHLLDVLTPHSTEKGGPLKLDHIVFIEGRGNLIIEYTPEGATGKPPYVNVRQ